MKLVCFLVVVFICEEVVGRDTVASTFKAIVDDLTKKHEQKLLDVKSPNKDPNESFKQTASTYAQFFADFLKNFNGSREIIHEQFKNLNAETWKGHYTTMMYLNDEWREKISLKKTTFRETYNDLINQKNLKNIQDNYTSLLSWCSYLYNAVAQKQFTYIEKVRDLYFESLLILGDLNNHNSRKYEILFIYLFNELKQFNGANIIWKNGFILNAYESLVYKHIKHRGPQNDNLSTYVKDKLDAIQNLMSGETQALKDAQFNIVSNEFINMYHYILLAAPKDYSDDAINKQFSEFLKTYRNTKSTDANYDIVKSGHATLLKIYANNRRKLSLSRL
ncbi:uncharacterized protein LOC116347801 [Contarinia nasturtii]|uniref:uncharacterized protein LOC116347801 n=1 Tax=Contarinia nasturtii TaxID=265458 RepID=UPI0012D3AE0B|nr:uncharacterized protein LOC116347801 [Contarinia nasturtii]